jgi:hypothetical protein
MNYIKNFKVTILVISVILTIQALKNLLLLEKKVEATANNGNKVSSTKRIQPKFAMPPAERRNQLLDRFQSILDGSSPRHWFPIPGTIDCPAADQSYHVTDRSGQKFTIQPILFEAMPYQNRSTAVFAWIGLPSEENIITNKVPAMVLVHGSGGTDGKLCLLRLISLHNPFLAHSRSPPILMAMILCRYSVQRMG